ncbi:MAG: hypothetical protein ACYC27_03195 [Armatimonadota bacterium]
MPHASTNGFITIPDGADVVSRAAYDAVLEEIDAALHGLKSDTAFYDVSILYGSVTIGDWDTSVNVTAIGTVTAPKGGFFWSGIQEPQMAKFSIPVNNVTAGDVILTIKVPRCSDKLLYQIDTGTKTEIVADTMTNGTVSITVPTGAHTVSFYIVGDDQDSTTLILGDWLTAQVVYNQVAGYGE